MSARRCPRNICCGEKAWERLLIRPPEFWASKQIELLLGCEVVSVAPEGQTRPAARRTHASAMAI